ncbi:MAG: MMPL family transporter [Actinomycetota bacterium]
MLYRLGRFSARRRWTMLLVWAAVIVAAVGSNSLIGGTAVDNFEVPGVESQQAIDLLKARFPERAGATAMVVFHTAEESIGDAEFTAAIGETMAEVAALPSVLGVTDPLAGPRSISPDGTTAFAAVQFDGTTAELGNATRDALFETAGPAEAAGVQVEYGGELPTILKERETGMSEAIGIVAALVILGITFGSAIAMALPVGVAALGLVVGLAIIGLLGAAIEIPTVAPRLATMIGLGVGIDYALFVLSRHRHNLEEGMESEHSIGLTNATAGQAVVFAGGTVMVAILGLQLAGIPFVAALGYSASLVVAVAVIVAVTLMPTLLGFAGNRVLSRSARHGTRPPAAKVSVWVRWAEWVAHHPWRSAIAATAILLVLAIPALDMRLGQADAGTEPATTTHRKAYDLLAAGFGDGFNGPLLIVIDLETATSPEAVSIIAASLAADPGIVALSPPELNPAGDTAVITAIPTTKPQDVETADLVQRLRSDLIPAATEGTGAEVLVGGPTAMFIDQSDKIADRLPWFILAVVLVSFLLLMIVFRSIVVPLTAGLMNLLSVGAAYGVVVAIFQWGWGRSLIGLEAAIPIASFVPMMMFAILFGLSMDYHVFILSRVREEYQKGHGNITSVVTGLGATAKVITAAALIMISVFLGFVTSADPVVKMMGIGLATAVAVDATIVRMALVPSVMAIVGDPNWWLPKWLDRLLPRLDLEAVPQESRQEALESDPSLI